MLTHLADVVAAVAHLGRARSGRRAARVEERVVLRKRVPAPRRDCDRKSKTLTKYLLEIWLSLKKTDGATPNN